MSRDLFFVRRFLDEATCASVRRAMDAGVRHPAEVLDDEPDARNAASVEVDEDTLAAVERRLDEQRETVAAFFDLVLTAREGAGFLRYEDGGFYRPHQDRADHTSWEGAADRQITVVVFLNGGFAGGVLRVGEIDVIPEAGTLVAFPSGLVHEVTTVRGGTRDTVIDWYY